MTLGKLIIALGVDTSELDEGLAKTFDRIERAGDRMKSVGSSLSIGVTAPIVGIGVGALKAASDFELAMTGIAKTVDAPAETLAQIGEELKAMSERMPTSATELAGVAEAAGQLGVEVENIVSFTETMAALGVSTNMSAEEAATALARFSNIMGTPLDQSERLGSAIVELGNNFATTEREITEMGMRIAGAGAQVGLTEGDVLGLATALSSVGIEAEAGGSAISKVMINMAQDVATGGENLANYARIAGMSIPEFSRLFRDDAATAITAFISGLGDMDSASGETLVALEQMGITEVRMRDALLRASGAADKFADALATGNRGFEENIALQNEAEKFYAANTNQLKAMWNTIVNLSAEFGATLIPVMKAGIAAFRDMVPFIRGLIKWFANLDPGLQRILFIFAGVAAAMGPVLFIGGSVVSMFAALAPVAAAAGISIGALVAPFILIPAAFAAVVAGGVAIIDNWRIISYEVKRLYENVKRWLLDKFEGIVNRVKGAVDRVTGFFKGMYRAVVGGSYVPDMIVGIKNEMARLDRIMVAPARAAASDVSRAMEALAVGPSSVTQIMDRYTSAIQRLRSLRMEAMFERDAKAAKELREQIALLESEIRRMGNAVSVLNELQITPRIVTGEVKTGRDLAGRETMTALDASMKNMVRTVNANARAINAETTARYAARFQLDSWTLRWWAVLDDVDRSKEVLTGGFQDLARSLGPSAFAMVLMRGVLEGLRPAFEMLMEPVALVGELLGAVLAPIIEALATPMRFLAKIATYVVQALGWLIRAIGKAINWLLPGNPANGLVKFGQNMIDQAVATRRNIDATNAATEATERMSKAISNMPSGYKLAELRQFQTAQPRYSSRPSAVVAGTAGGSVTYSMAPGAVVVQGTNKPVRQLVDEITGELERRRRSVEGV